MIGVEINEKQESVEIFLDSAGIEELIRQLESLRHHAPTHAHFMTPSWGGNELCEMPHGQNKAVNHLIVYSVGPQP